VKSENSTRKSQRHTPSHLRKKTGLSVII